MQVVSLKAPTLFAELGINKLAGGLGRVKDSLFKADGGPVETTGPGGVGGVGYNNPQEDYSDSVKRAKLLKGVLAGGGLMGLLDLMGDERMNLAKGGYAGKGLWLWPNGKLQLLIGDYYEKRSNSWVL